MKKRAGDVVLLAGLCLLAVGCGCGGGGANDQVKPEVGRQMSDANDLAQKVQGDWRRLTPAEQQKLIQEYQSKATAKLMIKNMYKPPNLQKHNFKPRVGKRGAKPPHTRPAN